MTQPRLNAAPSYENITLIHNNIKRREKTNAFHCKSLLFFTQKIRRRRQRNTRPVEECQLCPRPRDIIDYDICNSTLRTKNRKKLKPITNYPPTVEWSHSVRQGLKKEHYAARE